MKLVFSLFLWLWAGQLLAQTGPDFVITAQGDTVTGKVTYIPEGLVHFRADGQKKVEVYSPTEINGYSSKGILRLSKHNRTVGQRVFAYHYRNQDDSAAFRSATGLVVPEQGKITLYYELPADGGLVPSGIGYSRVRFPASVIYEIADTDDIYMSGIYSGFLQAWNKRDAVQTLARLLQDNPQLYNQVLRHKGKFDLAYVSGIIKTYNQWYAAQQAVQAQQ